MSNNDYRTADLGAISDLSRSVSAEYSLEMFRRICLTRYNDLRVRQEQDKKNVNCLIYLSVGQESIAASVSMSLTGSWVLAQHRCHGVYLSFGGNHRAMIDELLGLDTGANKGMGGSPPLQDYSAGIIGHNGLVGDQVPVAAGVALFPGKRRQVVCFFGDGAAEEDYVLSAMGFAGSRKLPILFVCEDNDLSVLTPTSDRRNWKLLEVAKSFGLEATDISDDPWLVNHWTRKLTQRLPALINVRTCRELWHVGIGRDGPPEWNRFELVKKALRDLELGDKANQMESSVVERVDNLWDERLQKRSGA